MASVRLRADQIQRLRECQNASEVVRRAIFRWKRGDFVIGKPKCKKGENMLHVFPLWKKPEGVEDWQIREILDQNWNIPDTKFQEELKQEIAKLDREISEMMRCMPPFIIGGTAE